MNRYTEKLSLFAKRIGHIILCFLASISCFTDASAQQIIPRFQTLSVNEGLSQSSVYSIYQDKIGYMWFGTGDGLNRYDGREIKIYKPNVELAQNGFSNFVKGSILEDTASNIWYANETGIFCYYRKVDVIKLVHKIAKPFRADIRLTHLDALQNLWLLNNFYGFYSYNIKTGKAGYYKFPPSYHPTNLPVGIYEVLNNNQVAFSLNIDSALCVFDLKTKKFSVLPYPKNVYYVKQAKNKYLLLTTEKLMITNDHNEIISQVHLPKTKKNEPFVIYDIVEDNLSRIWLSTLQSGLFCYNPNSNTFINYRHTNTQQHSLPIDICRKLFVDNDNNLWIGTDGGGISKLNIKQPQFNLFPLQRDDFPDQQNFFTKCFFEDEQKRIWTGTLNGFNIYNSETNKLSTHNTNNTKGLPGNIVGSILCDSKKNIWLGSSLGIGLFDEKENKCVKIKLPDNVVKDLHPANILVNKLIETTDGEMVAATRLGLIFYDLRSNSKSAYNYSDKGFVYATVTDVNEVSENNLWYTSPTNGLYHLEKQNNRYVFAEKFFENIDLRCIHKDEQDAQTIWIGSGIGLIKFNTITKQQSVYGSKNGLTNTYVYGVLEDAAHNLWLSTNGGIFKFNKKSNQFVQYNYTYGLQSNEFNTGAFYKNFHTGNLYFGGINGYNWFNPNVVNTDNANNKVAVAQVLINDEPARDSNYFFSKKIYLPYYDNNIAFKLASLNFTNTAEGRFQYQLKGWDKSITTNSGNIVRYSRLPPGKYIFTVKASNGNGNWSDDETVEIYIHPPFWQTWWFYTLVAISVLFIAMVTIRFYVKQKLAVQMAELKKQKEIEAERQRISREMHDDIGAGLTQIVLMSEAARNTHKENVELNDISATSRKLVGNMSEIIWSLNTENKTIEQLNAYLREQLNKQLEYSGMDFSIDLADVETEIVLGNQQKRNIILVTKEIVNNAIKYSKASEIKIVSIYENSSLTYTVTDNGIGFNIDQISFGNGLRNIRHRLEELNGNVNIESSALGTSFIYTIPL